VPPRPLCRARFVRRRGVPQPGDGRGRALLAARDRADFLNSLHNQNKLKLFNILKQCFNLFQKTGTQ